MEVDERGAKRLRSRHPWVFRSQVLRAPDEPGFYPVYHQGRFLALALFNPESELAVRAYAWREGEPWQVWTENLAKALAQRAEDRAKRPQGGRRLVHAEGDFLPGLVVDEYAGYLVVQIGSAALEARRNALVRALAEALFPQGILLKNNGRGRAQEGLPRYVEVAYGDVPELLWIEEGAIELPVRPHRGQKTGAFLDQRENRILAGELAARFRPQKALDVFGYQGGFALHIARHAGSVTVVDASKEALEVAEQAAAKNRLPNLRTLHANAFDFLKRASRGGPAYDLVVLDPPSFARKRSDLERAFAAYKEINLRAMRLVRPGGYLLTASCSHHLGDEAFLAMLREAAGDAQRPFRLVERRGQAKDHPVLVNVPETGYLKFAVLQALD